METTIEVKGQPWSHQPSARLSPCRCTDEKDTPLRKLLASCLQISLTGFSRASRKHEAGICADATRSISLKGSRNMQAIRIILPALLLATTASFAQDVRYNFAADQDFSKYKTYRWVDVKGADHVDQLAEQQLKTAIDEELAKKGLSRTENDKADLYVG